MRQRVEIRLVAPFLAGIDLANIEITNNARGDFGELDLGEVDSGAGRVAKAKLCTRSTLASGAHKGRMTYRYPIMLPLGAFFSFQPPLRVELVRVRPPDARIPHHRARFESN
jgi:hypothetical protein